MRLIVLAGIVTAVGLAVAVAFAWPGGSSRAQDGAQLAGASTGVIAFESDRSGNSDIFLQRGAETVRVTDEAAQQGQPAFGCDDHTIYIVSNQNTTLDIWRATAGVSWAQYVEGGDVQFDPLTSGPSHLDSSPYAYCGAPSYVFYGRTAVGSGGEVWRMDLDGGNPVNLTNDAADDGSAFPFVAADGTPSVVFGSNRDGDYDIYSMDMNGGNVQQLTNDPAFDYYPSVGIDVEGTRHLFFSSDRDGNAEIYALDLGTGAAGIAGAGTPVRLTNDPASDIDPVATLDERVSELEGTVVYTHKPTGGTANIGKMHFDGTGQVIAVMDSSSNSSAAALTELFAPGPPPPTEAPPTPTPTPLQDLFTPGPDLRARATLTKLDASTGRAIAGWQIEVFRGGACEGTPEGVYTTEGDGNVTFRFDQGGGPWSFREVQQPGWEQVTFIGDSPCQTIDGDEDAHVTFRNRHVGRLGDSNGDGEITAIDAALDLQFTAGFLDTLLGPGDANGDGQVNSIDATLKLQHVAGLYEIPVM